MQGGEGGERGETEDRGGGGEGNGQLARESQSAGPDPATHGCGRPGSQLSLRPDVTIREMGSPGPLKWPWQQRSRPCPLTECRSRRRGTPTGRSRVSGTPGFSGWIIYAVPTHDRTGGWGWGSQALARLSERRDRDSHTRGFRTERPAPSWAWQDGRLRTRRPLSLMGRMFAEALGTRNAGDVCVEDSERELRGNAMVRSALHAAGVLL